ncbi:NAD(P)-dependent oxidoreductase [Amycolatopsis rubida]|uniref:NAD(P)-dependent oxidoreductase n=1 Tax=Amycolatopsis rubida TaxID=112413 RepID=A0ABX0C7D7_9PSEU|nr:MULTISPECIES: NAD(P)-binding domain-containing protein [Amycolatopsis]MYW97639.1 NAD(P)-binding domain-containing protein [Amycolatopsis rubida]NEC62624.1 NAD(P)-dependent oxidoreductase [Amycolatopsis rubida]OAP21810.1 2-hydroxy-3-oxopropionate reductase [Amycolatopsis sp. M39]
MSGNATSATVLGLGAMGGALAGALLGAGRPVTVWNRSADKTKPLVERGAVAAESAAEAVAASELVIVCLLDDASVREVLATASPAGRTVVNLTNGTPRQARELAEWVTERGGTFLDGGIMAVPPMIGQPGAFVFYSGPKDVFDTHRAAFDTFGGSNYVGEDPGLAALHDLALLSGMYGQFTGILQAYALIRSEGLSAVEFAPLLSGWLTAMSSFVQQAAVEVDSGDYAQDVVSNLGMQAAAFENLPIAAADQGVSSELLAPLHQLLLRRAADGHGAENLTSVIELLKK